MILLEIVVAMTLFFIGSMFVLDAMTTSSVAVAMAQREAEAADLAVTVMSEVQLGLHELVDAGPEPFEDEALAEWTWEIRVLDSTDHPDLVQLKQIEVIIRHESSELVYRRAMQWWENPNPPQEVPAEDAVDEALGGGQQP